MPFLTHGNSLVCAGFAALALAACDPTVQVQDTVVKEVGAPEVIAEPDIDVVQNGLAGAWAVHSYFPAPDPSDEFLPNLFTMKLAPDSSFLSQMTCTSWECADIGSVAIAGFDPDKQEVKVPFRFKFLPSGTYRVLAGSDGASVMAILHKSRDVAWVFRRATSRAGTDVTPALDALFAVGFDPTRLVPVPNPFPTRGAAR